MEVKSDDDVSYYPAHDLHDLSMADVIVNLSYMDGFKAEEWKVRFVQAINGEFLNDKFA